MPMPEPEPEPEPEQKLASTSSTTGPVTATVCLHVPVDRAACGGWLETQQPDVVANFLEMSEHIVNTALAHTQSSADHSRMLAQHTKKLQLMADRHDGLTAQLQVEHVAETNRARERDAAEKGYLHQEIAALSDTLDRERASFVSAKEQSATALGTQHAVDLVLGLSSLPDSTRRSSRTASRPPKRGVKTNLACSGTTSPCRPTS